MMTAKKLRALRHQREKGAVAVIVAFAMLLLMAAAAVGVDLASLMYERQKLRNALDAAAAAGAQQLPGHPAQAATEAETIFRKNMPAGDTTPISVKLRCVVGYDADTHTPDWATVVSVCNITSKAFNASECNDSICSVTCDPTTQTNAQCNTITVKSRKEVKYTFGPAIGVPTGDTKYMTSVACRGFCGTAVPNPMDVVVMADRTPSMIEGDVPKMQAGIKDMLLTMTRDQQYIAFGAIHKSVTDSSGCVTAVNRGYTAAPYSTNVADGKVFTGSWVPTSFSNTYTTGNRNDGTLAKNTADPVYKAIDCLREYRDLHTYSTVNTGTNYTNDKTKGYPAGDTANGYGTHLASALKGAARYLYGYDANNLSSLPSREDFGDVQKVIIFETDGRPEEVFNSPNMTSTNVSKNPLFLDNKYDIGDTNGTDACNNLKAVATKIKALPDPPLIITIGYGNAGKFTCTKDTSKAAPLYNSTTATTSVRSILAAVASPKEGVAAVADNQCSSPAEVEAENTDNDYYFCAGEGDDLSGVFVTAMGSIKGHGRLMNLPGIE